MLSSFLTKTQQPTVRRLLVDVFGSCVEVGILGVAPGFDDDLVSRRQQPLANRRQPLVKVVGDVRVLVLRRKLAGSQFRPDEMGEGRLAFAALSVDHDYHVAPFLATRRTRNCRSPSTLRRSACPRDTSDSNCRRTMFRTPATTCSCAVFTRGGRVPAPL